MRRLLKIIEPIAWCISLFIDYYEGKKREQERKKNQKQHDLIDDDTDAALERRHWLSNERAKAGDDVPSDSETRDTRKRG